MSEMHRRSFLLGLSAICAPAIIRPGLLMPVKPILTGHILNVAEILGEDSETFQAWLSIHYNLGLRATRALSGWA